MRVRGLAILGTVLIGWIALFNATDVSAYQAKREVASAFLAIRWTTENGLPQNSVTSIAQTPDGYLWLGTFGGLARFDGIKFTIFNSGNTPALRSNRFTALHASRDGSLWIAGEFGEIMRFRNGEFSYFARIATDAAGNSSIRNIYEDRTGAIWVSAQGRGVTRFVAGNPARAESYDERHGLPLLTVMGVCEDNDGNLWVCALDGLALFREGQEGRAGKFTIHLKRGEGDSLMRIRPHPDGGLWVLTRNTLNRFHGGVLTPYLNYPYNGKLVAALSETATRDLLFSCSTNQIFQIGRQGAVTESKLEMESKPDGSQLVSAYVLFEDREGNIWMGTIGNGLMRLRRRRVTMLNPAPQRPDASGGPILEDNRGRLWFGTEDGLFSLYAGVPTAHFLRDSLKNQGGWRVGAIYQDRAGDVWFGKADGLARCHDGHFTNYPLPLFVESILEDRQGQLWFGGWRGLGRLHNGQVTMYGQRDGLPHDDVKFLLEDRAGALWLGTPGGLSRFQDGVFTNYTTSQGLSNNFVRAIHEDQDGALWLGTYGGGLNRMRNGRITHITTKQGLFDDFISRILPGDDDTFWLLGNRGIFQVSRRALNEVADGQRQSVTCVVYDAADGMNPSEGQGGFQPAGWRARDGRLYFPTIRGVAVVDPSLASKLAPPVIIERVLLDGQELNFRQPIEIPPGKGNLEIHYTGLSLGKPERVQFSFKLSGQNENWVDVGQRRTAYFPQLQPGRYRFSVKALSPDGVWSEREASLAFAVLPPFWRTAWFLSLVAMGVAGLALTGYRWRVAIYRSRIAQQEAFARRLIETQERERGRIAAELHDGLGQSLVIIKRRALLCLDAGEDPGRMTEQVEEIVEASTHAIDEVREVIFDLRPQQLDRLGLTGAVSDLLDRVANVNGWQLTKQLDEVDGLFPKEAENSLFRIVQESLNNASKHAAATHVAVSITRQPDWVELAVQDNGRGFAAEATNKGAERSGFGLRGITERARFLGGLAMVESAPEKGTTVRLKLPVKYGLKNENAIA